MYERLTRKQRLKITRGKKSRRFRFILAFYSLALYSLAASLDFIVYGTTQGEDGGGGGGGGGGIKRY